MNLKFSLNPTYGSFWELVAFQVPSGFNHIEYYSKIANNVC
jgi:hypothetical protein